ncbi:TetR/AcrR family transcriptional regulator [Luteimonas marina]|uniref:TetR/AcrR family transcriptional regulator n=1 Tax=Luteimonas marina TaxID=488485 RepID=A0A5C5TYC9_9GAMM|nr:TetR/AcrR family transcriptional regulator [Luteimonas marina]TWT18549.1 TetR/AcrR family transcriptional regulator [Luteimonas marina]
MAIPTPPRKTTPRDAAAAPPGKQRLRGRPRGDSPDLRGRLLDAALACYVRQGIAATSFRDIAKAAGATPAMLHYYFGDKAQLRQAVVDERILPVLAAMQARLQDAGDDVAALVAGFVGGIGAIVEQHPWLPSLWVREVLSEGGALRDVLLHTVGPRLPVMMAERFAQAQAQGRLNPDLDPRLLMVSLVGLTLFPAAGAPIWRALFDARDLDYAALRRHTLTLLDRGLELER